MKLLIMEEGDFSQIDSGDLTQTLLDKLREGDAYCVRVTTNGSFEEFNASSRAFDAIDYYTDDDDDDDADRNEVRNALMTSSKMTHRSNTFETPMTEDTDDRHIWGARKGE